MMKAIIRIENWLFLLLAVVLFGACSSKEDALKGSWTRTFGLNTSSYTEGRVFSQEAGKTFFHTFVFEKGTSGKGTFKDVVNPLVLNNNSDLVVVGSKISGEWEIKDNKLYLYYNDSVELTNGDDLHPADKARLEGQMKELFLTKFKEAGEKGFPYELKEKNNKTGIEIDFGNDKETFVKNQDKDN